MPHVRELIPVVVLNHSITSASSGIASIHREGCKDIEREARKHGSSIYGPYDSVDLALAAYIDSEMEELGYSDSDVKVHPCCRQRGDGTKAKEATMSATTTKTRLDPQLHEQIRQRRMDARKRFHRRRAQARPSRLTLIFYRLRGH